MKTLKPPILTLLAPDRPAPLSVKSRYSDASKASLPTNDHSRSISSPFHSRDMMTIPLPRCSVLFQDTISHPLLSPTTGSSVETDGYETTPSQNDVTGNGGAKAERQSDPFSDSKQTYEDQSSDYSEQNVHSGHDRRDGVGLFHFEDPDVASRGIFNPGSMNQSTSHDENDMSKAYHDFIGEESFDVMDFYAESNDGHSILEPISNTRGYAAQTVYKYSAPVSHSETGSPEAHYSLHQETDQARPRTRHPSLSASVVNFHLPLALRSYRSEAQIQSRFTGHSHIEPNMYDKVIPPRYSHEKSSRRLELYNTSEYYFTPPTEGLVHDGTGTPVATGCDNSQAEQLRTHPGFGTSSRHDHPQIPSGETLDLAAFPIPPMRNPVGELPMLLHRVASLPSYATTGQTVALKSTSTTPSVAETYRAMTKVHMIGLLKRTRSRGAQLPSVDWQSLSIPERVWREENSTILMSIYGRQDMVLNNHDIEYVNCVAQELRCDGDGISSNEWVLRILQDNI